VLGRANAVVEALEALAALLQAGVPADVSFLLSAVEVDKRRSFYKTLGKVGEVEVHDGVDDSRTGWEEKALALADDLASGKGLRFDADARELFVLLTGGDVGQIQNELEKIETYLAKESRQISAEVVQQLVARSRENVIFEVSDAIHHRDLRRALALIAQLLQQKESAVGILLVAIAPTVRNLLLMKDLQENHRLGRTANPFQFGDVLARLPADATAHLPRKKDGGINTWGLGFAAQAATRFTLPELRAGLQACLDANLALVTSATEPQIVLEELLVRLLARADVTESANGAR
jgi:DNA polymerase-3 subunit delta